MAASLQTENLWVPCCYNRKRYRMVLRRYLHNTALLPRARLDPQWAKQLVRHFSCSYSWGQELRGHRCVLSTRMRVAGSRKPALTCL